MLRAMILIVLSLVLLITILTQIVLPMFTEKLEFFWWFRKGSRDDIISFDTTNPDADPLSVKAREAQKSYKSVKQEIKQRKGVLDKLDEETDI